MTSLFAELTQLPRPTSEISSAGESWAVNRAPTAKGEKKSTENSLWAMFRPAVSLGDGRHTPQNVSLTCFLLGISLGVGLLWTWSALCAVVIPEEAKPSFSQALLRLGPFMVFMPLFHYLEYLVTSLYNPKALGFDTFTFTMDADRVYIKMMSIIVIEFLVEAFFVPEIKMGRWNWLAGLILMITGQAIRTLAMATTQRNFNHYVATEKDPDHVLVTHGIYSYVRHPSYLGYCVWCVGLQTCLANPLCFLFFAIQVFRFYRTRIAHEEKALIHIFGSEYVEYRKRTSAIIPFIL